MIEFIWHDEGRLLSGTEHCSFNHESVLTFPCGSVHSTFLHINPCVVFTCTEQGKSLAAYQWHPHLVARSGGNLGGFRENEVLLVSKA